MVAGGGKKHVNAALLLEAVHGKHCFHLVWTSTVKIESNRIESISDFLLPIEKDILIDINNQQIFLNVK